MQAARQPSASFTARATRTADLFIIDEVLIASDPALNAVLTLENPTFSTVFDVRCAQSYLLWRQRLRELRFGDPG